MNDLEKLLSVSENTRKIQQQLIEKQELQILQLEEKNRSLSVAYDKLFSDYEKSLSICEKQQALLDQIFTEHPEL